ncbi:MULTISPECIES: SDR family NAD(P)-dependent oxidoreductase [Kocuria]|uniref:SDR family NAD(P)-dependent oxidoreductase n=1 Tax=Kocuria subflava TaxID=1736139 RepID=A0A846TP05_9MICC|nr:SDR family NAD(P)-dependent oxidoreductase [Kocuria sp. CPCC 104605]NKE10153.1 SDR family NAD(P)-dependent oxidoreductase [Kocuria subflava]
MDLSNSSALVTGAASGLGSAVAASLAAQGVHVVGVDLDSGITRAQQAGSVPDGVTLVAADVTDGAAVDAAVETAQALAPVRTVVNCAGIAPVARIVGKKGPHDLGLFRTVIEVNLIGTFTVLARAAAVMAHNVPLEGGARGVVANTASVAAFEGQVGQAAYAASKGGVHSMTIAAARDLAGVGIRVCTIAPGIVETPMMAGITPEFRSELEANVQFPKRLARPEEYAQLVQMIVEHDYLNGETIRMDGALRMPPR